MSITTAAPTPHDRLAPVSLLASLLALACAPVLAEPDLIAEGLFCPKGLAFAPDGSLYVAEAGSGGTAPCISGADGAEVCYGATGAITQVKNGAQRRIASGLPSLAGPGGAAATGPHDVATLGNGALLVPIGLGSAPLHTAPGGALEGTGLGTLVRVDGKSGRWTQVADIAAHEAAENPDGLTVPQTDPPEPLLDTNPFGVFALPGRTLLADAGGNAVLEATAAGKLSVVALFANGTAPAPPFLGLPPDTQLSVQPVPTAVAQGPNGNLYVGQLTGFPFPVGEARVYEIVPGGGVVHSITGFTNIVDLSFGPNGLLYVVEISQSGLLSGQMDGAVWQVDLTQIDPAVNPTDRDAIATKVTDVFAPGGAAIGPDGALYVTSGTILPGGGVVLRYDLP